LPELGRILLVTNHFFEFNQTGFVIADFTGQGKISAGYRILILSKMNQFFNDFAFDHSHSSGLLFIKVIAGSGSMAIHSGFPNPPASPCNNRQY